MTSSTLIELSRTLAGAIDPGQFARATGFAPYDYQLKVLRSTAQQMVLNWSRQAGKSTATSYLPVHQAIYRPNSLVLILGPGERQAELLLKKVYDVIFRIGKHAVQLEKENVLYLRLVFVS